MRLITAVILVCLLSFATGCNNAESDITSPQIPESEYFSNTSGSTLECQANMRTIASQAVMYMANHNNMYPETLEDMGMGGLICPECGLQYSWSTRFVEETKESTFFLECPLPSDPNHGCIDNGAPSWTTPQEPSEDACRANMRTVASQAVMYFANHNRYPKTLEEIGFENLVCPVCNMEYVLVSDEESYFLECPLPTDPNHGNIDNGVVSWND